MDEADIQKSLEPAVTTPLYPASVSNRYGKRYEEKGSKVFKESRPNPFRTGPWRPAPINQRAMNPERILDKSAKRFVAEAESLRAPRG